nr:YeeE/YedE family protein [Anaerolineae bacterium]
ERGRFCFFCIFRDWIEHKNSAGMFSVLAALATGSIGYVILFGLFLPNAGAGRLPPNAHIGPVSPVLVAAGLAFGLGMAFSGACISGHLYRLGQGYTRAPFALFGSLIGFGLGFMTWYELYIGSIVRSPVAWLPATFGYSGALILQLGVLLVLAVVMWRWLPSLPARAEGKITARAVWDAVIHHRWNPLLTGVLVGLIGVFSYLRVEPLGVTAQLGSISRTVLNNQGVLADRLPGLDTFAGCATAVIQTISDNGVLIIALVLGSFAVALAGGRFKLSKLTLRGATTALGGGVLMGWGSMIALGCTVGVLLSGISAFALSGWVFALSTFAGVFIGIKLGIHRWE